jgi:hypothetical protein
VDQDSLNPDLDTDPDPAFQMNPYLDTDPVPNTVRNQSFDDQKLKKKKTVKNFKYIY